MSNESTTPARPAPSVWNGHVDEVEIERLNSKNGDLYRAWVRDDLLELVAQVQEGAQCTREVAVALVVSKAMATCVATLHSMGASDLDVVAAVAEFCPLVRVKLSGKGLVVP